MKIKLVLYGLGNIQYEAYVIPRVGEGMAITVDKKLRLYKVDRIMWHVLPDEEVQKDKVEVVIHLEKGM